MEDIKVCVFDGGTLFPSYGSEQFTMQTVVGSTLRSWLEHWACETCGLLYSPGIMVDPKIEVRRLAEEANRKWQQDKFNESFDKTFGERLRRLRVTKVDEPDQI